jgi:hypothetical protein
VIPVANDTLNTKEIVKRCYTKDISIKYNVHDYDLYATITDNFSNQITDADEACRSAKYPSI